MRAARVDLKDAFARWATGVTIVTARAGERVHGMTVSAFTEVSLDPPLVLVCIDKGANTQPVIEQGRVFAVNILARDQEPLARRFALKRDEDRRFAGVACEAGETGAPLIAGCVASLDCRLAESLDAGDHVIHVGRVVAVRLSDREPLMFHNRAYCSLAD